MPFDVMDDEQQQDEQQYQNVNGFKLPVPAKAAPVRTASNPTPVEGTHIAGVTPNGDDDAVKQAMTASATRMPQAPPQDDQLSSLVQQRQQAGQPLDRTNPRYRMGFRERLSGALANFASGVNGGGVVKPIGPGAMNRKYYNDKIDQIDRTKNLDVAIGNREKLDEQNRKEFDSATKQAFESQVASARQDTARARQGTADAQQQTADVKQQLANAKTNPIDQRIKDADRMGLKDKDRRMYLANGKLPEGMTDYQKSRLDQEDRRLDIEDRREKDAAAARRGNAPTFKDKASVDKYSDNFYRQERGKVEQQKKNWMALNKDASDEETQAAMKAIENEYQQRANDFEERKKGYYAEVENQGRSTAAPTQADKVYTNGKDRIKWDGSRWVYADNPSKPYPSNGGGK